MRSIFRAARRNLEREIRPANVSPLGRQLLARVACARALHVRASCRATVRRSCSRLCSGRRVPRYECIRLVRANGRRRGCPPPSLRARLSPPPRPSFSFVIYLAINQFRKRAATAVEIERRPTGQPAGLRAYANAGATQLIISRSEDRT